MENHPKNGGFGVPPHDFGNLHMTSGGMNIRGEVVAMIEGGSDLVYLCLISSFGKVTWQRAMPGDIVRRHVFLL
jgi:hypothetical protein